jgi:hypothetical protein
MHQNANQSLRHRALHNLSFFSSLARRSFSIISAPSSAATTDFKTFHFNFKYLRIILANVIVFFLSHSLSRLSSPPFLIYFAITSHTFSLLVLVFRVSLRPLFGRISRDEQSSEEIMYSSSLHAWNTYRYGVEATTAYCNEDREKG